MIANPYILLGLGIAWASSLVGAAKVGYDHHKGKVATAQVERQELLNELKKANEQFADKLGLDVGFAISQIKINHRTVVNEVRHEREVHHQVLNNPDCRFPDSTVRLLNSVRGTAGSVDAGKGASNPSVAVPTVGASDK